MKIFQPVMMYVDFEGHPKGNHNTSTVYFEKSKAQEEVDSWLKAESYNKKSGYVKELALK